MGWKRRVAAAAGIGIAVVALPVGAVGSAFIGLEPLEDGRVVGGLTTVQDGYVAMYLGHAADGSLFLIDGGNDPAGTALIAALQREGRTLADVRTLLLTHGHPDHLGVCGLLPNARVVALTPEIPVITGADTAKGPLPRWMANDGSCRVDAGVTDGAVVDVGGTSVTAYALPGHTVGSAAWLVDGVLVFGDAASGMADGRLVGPPWVFSDDTSLADASLAGLGARVPSEVAWLAFAHTGPLEGAVPLRAFQPR